MTNKVHLSQVDELIIVGLNSTTLLAAAGTYIGDVFPVGGYTHISGFAFSNVSSATNGLRIEQGLREADFPTGAVATANVTRSVYSIIGNDIDNNAFAAQVVAPFARIVYVNGASVQTVFKLYGEARILRGL